MFWHRCGKREHRRGWNFFLSPAEGEIFSPPCVCTQNGPVFVQNSNVGEGHENKTSDPLTRPPSRLLAAGPSICDPSLEGGRGGPEAAMREAFRGSHPEDTGLEARTASRPPPPACDGLRTSGCWPIHLSPATRGGGLAGGGGQTRTKKCKEEVPLPPPSSQPPPLPPSSPLQVTCKTFSSVPMFCAFLMGMVRVWVSCSH